MDGLGSHNGTAVRSIQGPLLSVHPFVLLAQFYSNHHHQIPIVVRYLPITAVSSLQNNFKIQDEPGKTELETCNFVHHLDQLISSIVRGRAPLSFSFSFLFFLQSSSFVCFVCLFVFRIFLFILSFIHFLRVFESFKS